LQSRSVLSVDKLKEIEDRVTATIDDAVEFAVNAPDPQPEDAVGDLYA
jgi:TPP-dependent pyruvate/acetoin dehydrogenase alpha subunit